MKQNKQSIFKQFLQYVTLNILGMIGLSCYILADTYFVAKGMGTNGLTALNLAIPIYSFIHGLGLMIGMGAATKFSIMKEMSGRKTVEQENHIFSQAILFTAGVALCLFLVGLVGTRPLSIWLGADALVQENTSTYLKVILMFSPMFLLNNVLICFIRNDNNPKLSMIAMLVGSFSNIVLDYVFIFIGHMGMFGAALATGIAPVISIIILSQHFITKKNTFKLVRVRVQIRLIGQIVSLGATSLITEVSSGIVMITFNMIILNLSGNVGVAAYGIIANLALVATAIFTGLAQGIQPILSSAYGARDRAKVRQIYKYGIVTGVILGALIYGITFSFADALVLLFNEENELVLSQIATNGIRIYFTAFVFVGFNIITATYFSCVDKARNSFIISMLRGIVLIIPIAYVLSETIGINGVWCTLLLTEILTGCFGGILLLSDRKTRRK